MQEQKARDLLLDIGGYLFVFTFVIPVTPFLLLHFYKILHP
jgi:hypothetical protein